MGNPDELSIRSRVGPATRVIAQQLTVVVAVTFLGGILTLFAQGFLPDAVRSFANSASGWTLITAVTVWALKPASLPAAAFGAVGFTLLVLGYTVAAGWQDLYYDPRFFGAVGLLAGPFVGVAASWLHHPGWRAALGGALLAGIGLGESTYGLLYLAGTTSPVYWTTIGALGLALLAHTVIRRAGRASIAMAACAGAAAIAGAFVLVYRTL